jgi:pSer/pThr/pTyr-binding forkhead associated (FHA) protein
MNKLIIEDDEGKTTIVPLIRDEITIGRKEGNTIRLTERNVSRRHAKLIKSNSKVVLEDLGSYNGIKVNGNKIKERTPVKEGDRIQIGDYVLALKVDAQGEKKADPFDEMKTIPMEKAEVEANIKAGEAAANAPAGAEPAQAAQPASQEEAATGSGATPAASQASPAASAPTPAAADAKVEKEQQPDLAEAETVEGPYARIVVLSNPLRGAEYDLSKKGMVIGRWPENDIVIDHPSISRHHAKIVNEEGRYSVVDMESQNGVLVNGDKYDRVELRKGDLIDLGHVRIRFVAPGEEFDIHRDVDWAEGKSKVGLFVTIAVLAALGVLAAILLWPSDEEKVPTDEKGGPGEGKPTVARTGGADAGEAPRVVSLDRSKINAALAARDWEKAIQEAQAFSKLHPDDSKTKQLMATARQEKENEEKYKKFRKQWKKGNYQAAAKLGKNFPKDSVYYKEISSIWPQAVKKYTEPLLKKARVLARREKCAELRALSRKVTDVNPEETRFQALIDKCGRATGTYVASRGRHRGRESRTSRHTRDTRTTRPDARDTSSSSGGKSASQLLNEARSALLNNQYSKALRLGRAAYRKNPSSTIVLIIGQAACKTRRPRTAKWAYRKLSGGRKRLVAKTCSSRGIDLTK